MTESSQGKMETLSVTVHRAYEGYKAPNVGQMSLRREGSQIDIPRRQILISALG